MKLLNSFGPNPRMVRMFLLERGITLEMQEHDLLGGENRKPPYTDKNPGGQLPSLELDDGTVIAETVAICEYLDETEPGNTLVGNTPEEKAASRMWLRRVELNITEPMYSGFRFAEGLELFKDRMYCRPDAAEGLKEAARRKLKWLDGLMAGKSFITGEQLRMVDLVLYCCVDFGNGVGQPLDPSLANVSAWYQRMNARPSATASLHPAWEQVQMRG